MRFFSNRQNYQPEERYQLNIIAKSLWNNRSVNERHKVYGNWVDLYTSVPDPSEAEICILTYQWQYYVANNNISEAKTELETARDHGKHLVIFSGGDYPANVPFEDVILFEYAGYQSTPRLRYHSSQPSYINDYVEVYNQGKLTLRPKREIPTIGFCGQASTSHFQTVYRNLRLKWQQQRFHQEKLPWEPPPFETTSFRTKVLKCFENQVGIQTNFIPRKRYRAGETQDKSPHHPAKLEFVNNILNSDYTICMRGGGNFSVRFYETLSLGRIPVFIDTDCLLPFQDEIDYKAIFPWIDIKDLPHAAEIVRSFHAKLSNEDVFDLQRACRNLWVEHMTPDGFHQDFVKKINQL
jgi:hypothetical protein